MTATLTHRKKLRDITNSLHGERLSLAEQDSLTIQVHSLVFRSALVRFLEQLEPKERELYRALIARGASEEECHDFLAHHKGEMALCVGNAIDELASDILSGTD
ncbi:MAG: hypothetical protein AAB472_01840 [Patescibacteria group bacterium]